MTLLESIAELSVEAIHELGAPLTLLVVGTDGWTSITQHDEKHNMTNILLNPPGDPDDHLPLTIVCLGPNRACVHRIEARRAERVN